MSKIKNISKHSLDKVLIITILLTIVFYAFFNVINVNSVYAAQTRESYSSKIDNYPGYKALIEKLKTAHPNWKFTILYTGLDWAQVLKNETTAVHGRNVVPAYKDDAWKCSTCGDTPRGGSDWRCASEAAVAYYMDPRNWLNDSYIFEFENLSYNGDIQTVDGVKKIISDIGYMNGNNKVTYTKTDGTTGTLNKTYAEVIMNAAKEAGISPYHLASRIRQEQGTGSTPGSTATGTYGSYKGYYNFLNIGASGSTDSEVIANGLEYAKNEGWTDPEKSIIAGAKMLAQNYIKDGQDTLYLQKFDVDNSDGALYWHQYMQNASAAVTEGAEVRSTYNSLGLLNSSIEFVIPVFENMPDQASKEPISGSVVTHNVMSTGDGVSIRSTANGTYITSVNKGQKMLRIELAADKVGGHYWDKVVLPNGTKGYMARDYIQLVDLYTNCNETMIANNSVNLRNGPGTSGTSIITTLTEGQIVTRIEKGMYNGLDGYNWDRITLSDGRGGYVASQYLSAPGSSSATSETVKVICNSGLKVREQPGTDQKVLTYVSKNEILTRTKAGASTANGYVWDKVITGSGIEGYIARGDSTEQYIEVVQGTTPSTPSNTTSGKEIKVQDTNLICEPGTSIESIKEKYSGSTTITVKNAKGEVVNSGNVGTGYKITISDKTYTIVKLGDSNGDGKTNAVDLLLIKREILGTNKLESIYKSAVDLNNDGKTNAVDLLLQKRHILGSQSITL